MRERQTFQDILQATAGASSRRVAERARLANRTAKCAASPAARVKAYEVKSRALEHGIAKFAASYELVSLERDGELAAVRSGKLCLHLPLTKASPQLASWIRSERNRISRQWSEKRRPPLAA